MGNTRDRMREARDRVQTKFRRFFPKVQTTLKKSELPLRRDEYPQRPDNLPLREGGQFLRPDELPLRPGEFFLRPNQMPLRPVEAPAVQQGLKVTATIRFEAPFQKVMTRTFTTTKNFTNSQELVDTFIRRLEHCTNELITRTDASATQFLRHTDPRVKPARYHVLYQVQQDGEPAWDRFYTSYDNTAITDARANMIMLEIDRIIAEFLAYHDADFIWRMPPVKAELPSHRSTAPEIGKPQDLHCIPIFDEPAYTIKMALRSKIGGRDNFCRFEVSSKQSTPLTLGLGENMTSQLSTILSSAIKKQEAPFAEDHAKCDGFEGSYHCDHFEEGAFELILKVKNNFGPDYGHLADRFQTYRRLVPAHEITMFLNNIEKQVEDVRDLFDDLAGSTDDLTITVKNLFGHNWAIENPMKITIDSASCRNRTTIDKILQRLQSGCFEVLKGHGTTATVTVHKRGHLVLDTQICRGESIPYWDMGALLNIPFKQRTLLRRLSNRMRIDIEAILKDTIRLHPVDDMAGVKAVVLEIDNAIYLHLSEEAHGITNGSKDNESDDTPIGLGITIPANTVPCDDDLAEEATAPQVPDQLNSPSCHVDDGGRTPAPPSLVHSVQNHFDDAAHASTSLETTLSYKTAKDDCTENNDVQTPTSPGDGFPPKSEDDGFPPKCEDDDAARMPPSLVGTFSAGDNDRLPCIAEEDDDIKRTSQQTILRTPRRGAMTGTDLLSSMTGDNLRAGDIPKFTPTRCWAGEDIQGDSFEEDDAQRTITPNMFRRAQGKPGTGCSPKTPRVQYSNDSLNSLLTSPYLYTAIKLSSDTSAGEDQAENAFVIEHDTKTVPHDGSIDATIEMAAQETVQDNANSLYDANGIYCGPMDSEEGPQHSRVPSGETESTTSRSSQSSQPLRKFPRRRSNQTPVVPPEDHGLNNPIARQLTFPLGQHSPDYTTSQNLERKFKVARRLNLSPQN